MPADRVRLLRRKHILWIIEHHPDHDTLREFGVIAKSGVSLADPEGWSAADRLWGALLRRYATCTRTTRELPRPKAPAGLHDAGREELRPIRPADSPRLRCPLSESGAAARRELESVADANLASGAANALTRVPLAPTLLHSQFAGIEVADHLADHLFRRAIELDPGNPPWKSGLASFYWTSASRHQSLAEKIAFVGKMPRRGGQRCAAHLRASPTR